VPPGYAPCRATWTGFKGPRRRLAGAKKCPQRQPQGEGLGRVGSGAQLLFLHRKPFGTNSSIFDSLMSGSGR
jgi:hypothetical protein